MTPPREATHKITSFVVEAPGEVDAGAEVMLRVRVSCSPELDLSGQILLVKDSDGAVVGRAELVAFDGDDNETDEFVVRAPAKVGAFTWSVVCPAIAGDGVELEETAAPFSFTVAPHATRVVVWDIPPTLEAGQRFRLKVGIKCSSECRLTGRALEIRDGGGARVAAGVLGDHPWQGTTALYYAEVDAEAPDAEGLQQWEARVPAADITPAGSEAAYPHGPASISFAVRVVPPPEFVVRVEAFDREKQVPLQGARVVLHPYRAVTDERGVAEVRVPRGTYNLQVSQAKYAALGMPVEVMSDVATRAELDLEPIEDIGDMY